MKPRKNALPFRTALAYALFGIVWILVSDLTVELGIQGSSITHAFTQIAKGLFFVLASSGFIYLILKAYLKSIQESEHRIHYQAGLLENVPDALISTDLQFNIITWNAGAESVYGWKAKEVLGKEIEPFLKTEYLNDGNREKALRALTETGHWEGEVLQSRKDGSRMFVTTSVSFVKDEKGGNIGLVAVNRDISHYKSAEEKLRRSESSLADAQEISNLGSWEWDVESRQGYWSRKMFQMFGFEPAESPPDFDAYIDHIHPEDRPIVLDALEKMSKGELPAAYEYRNNPERMPLRYFQPTWRVIRDENGAPIKFQGTVLDITERKTNEQRIQYLSRLYATLSQVNQTIVRVKTREELFNGICKVAIEFGEFQLAWIGLIDHKSGQVTQTTVCGLDQSRLPFQEVNIHKIPFKGGLVGTAFVSGKVEVSNDIQADPQMAHWHEMARQNHYHSAAAIPIRQGGDVVAMINLYAADIGFFEIEEEKKLLEEMGTDISFALDNFQREADRIQAERALRQSEERFYKAFHSSPVGMYISRADDKICIDINEAFCEIAGYSHQELVGRTTLELGIVSPEQEQEYMSRMRSGGYIRNHEMDIRRKSGEIRAILGSMEMIKLDDQTCVLSTAIDITARKQARRELKEAHDRLEERVRERTEELRNANLALEKASRQKDEFLAGMSHELRTPLNAVISLSESLQEGIYGGLSQKQGKIIDLIGESGRHLLELINDILDLSKIEAGKLELQYETVPLKSLCETSLRMVQEDALKKELKISLSIEDPLKTIWADRRRLQQMLVNLLSNAVKFTPKGGSVGLEVASEHEDAIRFTVWDTGVGIHANQLNQLFIPFTQLDNALSRKYNGTGLGLALVRQLAEMHNGSVGVESAPGNGSRFYFVIPARDLHEVKNATSQATVKLPSAQQDLIHTEAAILLVEDNQINQMVTNDYLTSKGYKVVTANNGHEALEHAAAHKPDLIIMDIQMPEMDGLEAIRRLRATPKFAAVPIIALTALAMPGDRERCLEAGADEYLAKPVSPGNLVELMEQLLAQSRSK